MSGAVTEIETARLQLRRFTLDDAEIFFILGSHPEVIRYATRAPLASLDEARERLLAVPMRDYTTHGCGRLLIIEKTTAQSIGWCGLKYNAGLGEVDIGYRLLPEYWGNGYAGEACRAVIERGWPQPGLRRLVGTVHPDNARSRRLLISLGFSYERNVHIGEYDREFEMHVRPLAPCDS
jgi:RimJ/RimL family protein N-acetyltransferase